MDDEQRKQLTGIFRRLCDASPLKVATCSAAIIAFSAGSDILSHLRAGQPIDYGGTAVYFVIGTGIVFLFLRFTQKTFRKRLKQSIVLSDFKLAHHRTIQFVAAIAGAIEGAFVVYIIVAFVLCKVLNLGNLCGLPAVFIGLPIGAIAGAIVGWRLGRRSS